MALHRSNFHVLTGGSGSGKSTIITALKKRGYACVEEAGRQLVQDQVRTSGDATPWQDRGKFRELLFARSVALFKQVTETDRPVFFDRGIVESIAYARFLGTIAPPHHRAAVAQYRYADTVFVTPPWREIYANDAERPQTWADAVTDYRLNCDAYRDAGYTLVEVPRAPVATRVDFILRHLGETPSG